MGLMEEGSFGTMTRILNQQALTGKVKLFGASNRSPNWPLNKEACYVPSGDTLGLITQFWVRKISRATPGGVMGTPKSVYIDQLSIFASEVMPAFRNPAHV